jgi:hypothetical protein
MSSASATSLVDTPLVWSLLTIHCLTTYKEACQRGEVAIGKMLVVETNQLHGRTYVVNFPTKKHWRAPSQLSYIDAGLVDLVVPLCCIALIMVAARRIRIFLRSSSCPVSWRRPATYATRLDAAPPRHSVRGRLRRGIQRRLRHQRDFLPRQPPLVELVERRPSSIGMDVADEQVGLAGPRNCGWQVAKRCSSGR